MPAKAVGENGRRNGWFILAAKMKNTQKWISEDILRYFEKHNISTIDVAFIENQMSPQQIYHYLRRMEKESGLPVEKILTVWRDYLSMAKK